MPWIYATSHRILLLRIKPSEPYRTFDRVDYLLGYILVSLVQPGLQFLFR